MAGLIGLTEKDARAAAEAVRWHQRHKNDGPVPAARRHRTAAAGGVAGTQLTYYEVATTPDGVNYSATYKLRSCGTAAWANDGTDYAVDVTVTKDVGSPAVNKTYKCILAHKSGGAEAFVGNKAYAVGERVWNGSRNNTTYICSTLVAADEHASFPAEHFSADNDEPGKSGGAWANYWVESYLDGYIFAPPFSGYIEAYAPILITGEKVLTILDDVDTSKIWIISPAFIHTGQGLSIKWDLVIRRIMSVFGG